MAGKANVTKSVIDEFVELKKEKAKQFGVGRQARSVNTAAKRIGSSSGKSNSNDAGNFLKTEGGPMIGPIAFHPKAATIASGVLDISNTDTGEYSSRIIALGEGSAADDLVTINGAAHAGQILFLQAVSTTAITLKHATGNIYLPTAADYVIAGKEIVVLQWDTINTTWTAVANFVVSGGGGGMNQDLSNMTSPTVPPVALSMNNQDILQVKNIDFDGVSSTIQGLHNLDFAQTSHSINSLSGIMLLNTNAGDVFRFSIGGVTKMEIQTSKIDLATNVDIDFNNNEAQGVGKIVFNNNTGDFIESTASGIVHDVNATDEHFFRVGGVQVLFIDSSGLEMSNQINMNFNDVTEINNLRFNTAGQVLTTSASEILYQVPSGDKHGFYVAAAKTLEIDQTHLVMQTNKEIDFGVNITLTASAGFQTLPSNPVGFIKIKVNGADARVPYYGT